MISFYLFHLIADILNGLMINVMFLIYSLIILHSLSESNYQYDIKRLSQVHKKKR